MANATRMQLFRVRYLPAVGSPRGDRYSVSAHGGSKRAIVPRDRTARYPSVAAAEVAVAKWHRGPFRVVDYWVFGGDVYVLIAADSADWDSIMIDPPHYRP